MRVVIDAHMVGSRETGNETYVVNLLTSLARYPNVRCGAAVVPSSKLPRAVYDTNIDLLRLRPASNWVRLAYALPLICRRWEANILHVTYIGPFFLACPLVVSVHDVSFRRYPEFFSPRDRLLFHTLLPLTLRRASAVITLSKHAKREILDVFPYLQGRVHAIRLAPSALFRPVKKEHLLRTVRLRYGINADFILAVGNLQPRKNLLSLINAFAAVHQWMKSIQLVIVGKAQWQSSALYAAARRLGLEEHVVFTGYVPNEDLVMLYNSAKVFVYPSIYEGFGLPVLEAMACGIPVVASNTSSIPEVAGDAAILIDPYQPSQIAEAIHRILRDPDMALSLSESGLRQARRFSWQGTAQETLAVYQEVLSQRRRRRSLP